MFNQKSLILWFSIFLLNNSVFTTSNNLLANEITNKEDNNSSIYHGIPLNCYLKNGVEGVHTDLEPTSEIINFESQQWSEIILKYAEMEDWQFMNTLKKEKLTQQLN